MKPNSKNGNGKKRFALKMKVNLWTIVFGIAVVLFVVPLVLTAVENAPSSEKVDISQALGDIKDGKINKVVVENDKLIFTYKDGSTKFSTKEPNDTFADLLNKAQISPTSVSFSVSDQSLTKVFTDVLSVLLPLGLMAAFFFFIIRSQNKGVQDIF